MATASARHILVETEAACLELNAWNATHGSAVGLETPFVIGPHFDGDVEQSRDGDNLQGGRITFEARLVSIAISSVSRLAS